EALDPALERSSESRLVRLIGGRYVLAPTVTWDMAEFRRLVSFADRPDARPADMASALSLFRGDFLPEPLFAEYDWLFILREQARADALRLLDRYADAMLAEHRHDQALTTWDRALAVHPFHEPSHRGIMRVHLALGRRADAEAQYRLLRDLL